MTIKKKIQKYNQVKDKKKLCPLCNGRVFNATRKCQLIVNNQKCGYFFISKRQKKSLNENKKLEEIKKSEENKKFKEIKKSEENKKLEEIESIGSLIKNLNILDNEVFLLNKLASKYDIECLSPYKEKQTKKIEFSKKFNF